MKYKFEIMATDTGIGLGVEYGALPDITICVNAKSEIDAIGKAKKLVSRKFYYLTKITNE